MSEKGKNELVKIQDNKKKPSELLKKKGLKFFLITQVLLVVSKSLGLIFFLTNVSISFLCVVDIN